MQAKYRAGNEIRTRDIQLGKLVPISENFNNSDSCTGKNQAAAGLVRPYTARAGWEDGWEDPDPLSPLRRVTIGGGS